MRFMGGGGERLGGDRFGFRKGFGKGVGILLFGLWDLGKIGDQSLCCMVSCQDQKMVVVCLDFDHNICYLAHQDSPPSACTESPGYTRRIRKELNRTNHTSGQ